ncbi:lysine-specific demethylase 8 [Aplysia californica]|uniref:Lysine-specific demethylase 8 n=1 Tax=Aplysia californica TaxID=6500 RepID=A0ABM1ADB0_APLCA|nr:lysine-specific demethylase 8 [Aplysia californica]
MSSKHELNATVKTWIMTTLTVTIMSMRHGQIKDNDVAHPKGHLRSFGSSGTIRLVNFTSGFPETRPFLEDYIISSEPLLMRGAQALFAAYDKWTDEYLAHTVTQGDAAFVWCETQKKEARSLPPKFMSFSRFLKIYNVSDLYVVDTVPEVLAHDVVLPCPLQCPALKLAVDTSFLWFSSGGTKSVVHVDSYENILCVLRGSKTVTMVSTAGGLDKFPFQPDGSIEIDVEKVDLHKFSVFAEVEFVVAHLSVGDCLYIPTHWIHQVNSSGSNIAVNVWWGREPSVRVAETGACHDHVTCDPSLTLDTVTWPWSGDDALDGTCQAVSINDDVCYQETLFRGMY